MVGDLDVQIQWSASETDPTNLRGFLRPPAGDFTIYNVIVRINIKRMTEEAFQVVSVPVARALENNHVTMKPEIAFRNVRLYLEKGDAEPEALVEELRVITSARPSIGQLYIGCVNLTPIKWRD